MSDEFDLTPKLGRIGNRGSKTAKGTLRNIRRRAAKTAAVSVRPKRSGFQGQRFGKGAGFGALSKTRQFSRARRAVVKVHIARAGLGGTGGFGKHVNYIRRDGTERNGSASTLYDREHDRADENAFNERSADDVRQFRIILSPEDGHELTDMKAVTRDFMAGVERDLGERLDWVAANHHNTAHPHTHIVIRGRALGDELIIAKDYITHGLRARAREVLTNELGLRREQDIARGQFRETQQDRWTSIDRALSDLAEDRRIRFEPALGSAARFDHSLYLKRLAHLEGLGLAEKTGRDWHLTRGWKEALRRLGREGDIIRTLAHELGRSDERLSVQPLSDQHLQNGPLIGTLTANLPGDELRNGRMAIIEDIKGNLWSLDLTERRAHDLPAKGGIVALSPGTLEPRRSDRTIAALAMANKGIYSGDLHAAADPTSSSAYRLAHKRRLEALRRAGIVTRLSDGSWQIPQDFEARAAAFDKRRLRPALSVLSWLPLEALITHKDAGWLDIPHDGAARFSAAIIAAKQERNKWLRAHGQLSGNQQTLSPAQILDMQKAARLSALQKEAQRRQLRASPMPQRGEITGLYSGHVDLPQGRFIQLTTRTSLTLAPWRAGMGAYRGQRMTLSMSGQKLTYQLVRARGRSR